MTNRIVLWELNLGRYFAWDICFIACTFDGTAIGIVVQETVSENDYHNTRRTHRDAEIHSYEMLTQIFG